MKKLSTLLLAAALVPTMALAAGHNKSAADLPTFVKSDNFGFIHASTAKADREQVGLSAVNFLEDLVTRGDFQAMGGESFEVRKVSYDDLGQVHVRTRQLIHGLEVVNADLIVHADAASGRVEAVNGLFAPNRDLALMPMAKTAPPRHAFELQRLGLSGDTVGFPSLKYFFDTQSGRTHLVWEIRLIGDENGMPFDNFVYVDAADRSVVGVSPQFHTAKVWRTYDAENNSYTSSFMPGTLLCSGSQNCGDSAAQAAHDGASDVYDYYFNTFGRDSLNDAGMAMISSVHVLSNWNNAAWYNNQMIYGDGDGSTFSNLALGFDVIGHELTHGVTDFESDLVYANESGALNEAWSDIFGAAAEAYRDGNINSGTWLIGEDVYTPGTNGDALRYMDDPTLDGYSTDYYPERLYAGRCRPTNSNDQCGVHGNSGIANLAFYLLVEGGSHPRGKTSEVVTGVGISTAEQVFYRAQTTYLTSGSEFSDARAATEQAAADLFGQSVVDSVGSAWCAVGVGSCGGTGSCSAVGASCSADSDCCSGSCKGRPGNQTCK